MRDEREEDRVEIEILQLTPPRLRIRGSARAAAEAVRALVEDGLPATLAEMEAGIEEAHRDTETPMPGRPAILDWVRARAGEPYTLIDLISSLTATTPEEVHGLFYVRAGKENRIVGSDYRGAIVTRHRSCAHELEGQGWRLVEERARQGPTRYQLLPPTSGGPK